MGALLNRRRYMGGGSSLPYDAEVEYLESTGTQWIDTGIIPTTTTYVRCKFVNLSTTGEVIIGFHDTESNAWRLFNVYSGQIFFDLPSNNNDNLRMNKSSGGIVVNTLYEYELGNRYVKDLTTGVNILENATLSTRNGTNSIGVSGTKKGGTRLVTSKNRFYYVQIYDGSILFDGIPVRVGQIGYMYDRVSGELFGNSGTGSFILGSDKT